MTRSEAEPRWVAAEASAGDASLLAPELARALALPEAAARLLLVRGLGETDAARLFLQPAMGQLHDPQQMLGLAAATERLLAALRAQEPVLIYGDYDVDGTVATVLLKTALERAAAALGVPADVRYHIPHRLREGYGMQEARLESAAAEGVQLVVSVDTGIRAFAAAEEARRLGLDLIVTDHHLPDELGVPEALAVLNPNQPGCPYPFKELCGAGVAFKLAQAVLEQTAADEPARQRLREKTLPSFLKLLAIATIADAVPLRGENRVIAALGLRELQRPTQPGLRTLMALAGVGVDRPISAMDVGFRLAPRINAAGRMDVAADVVEMFLTRDEALAATLAEKLHRLNEERRTTEAEALRAIEAQIESLSAAGQQLPACLVLDDLDSAAPQAEPAATAESREARRWHRGVIGILASRVVERTGRPALVIAHEDGQAYGSGRSVSGFPLLDALTAAQAEVGLFTRFGGHAHAVGFTLPSGAVPELRQRMAALAEPHLASLGSGEVETYDMELQLNEVTPEFLAALEAMGPFGSGHHEPVFLSRGLRLARAPRAVQQRSLRLAFQDPETERTLGGMAWGRRIDWVARAQQRGWAVGQPLDVLYRLQRNWHPEFGGWEMQVLGLRDAESD